MKRIYLGFIIIFWTSYFGIYTIAQECTIINYTVENGLPTNGVTHLIFDKKNNLWIGTNGGLCLYDGQELAAIKDEQHPKVISFFKDSKKSIYLADENKKIYKLNDKSHQWKSLDNFDITQLGLDIYGHNDFGSMTTHEYWDDFHQFYFFVDSRLIKVSPKNRLTVMSAKGESIPIKSSLPKNIFTESLIFESGNSTFAFTNNCIYKLSIESDSLIKELVIKNIPLDKDLDALSSGQYNERTGYFYLGSSLNGLFEIKPSVFDVRVSEQYYTKTGNAIYYHQVEYDKNSVLVNNQFIINPTGTNPLINNPGATHTSLSYVDQQNIFWFWDKTGLRNSKQISTILEYPRISDSSLRNKNKSKNIRFIDETKFIKTNKLFSEDSLSAMYRACEGINNIKYFCSEYNLMTVDSLSEVTLLKSIDLGLSRDEKMTYLFKKKNDSLIYILTSQSIYKYNPSNKKTNRINSLPFSDYRLMTYVTDNIIFLGTYGQGFYIIYEDRYIKMPLDKNEYLKFAHTALCDASGHVWISTNHGLLRTRVEDILEYIQGDRNEIFYHFYDKSSGFKTNEFNGGCQSPAIKLNDGTFSFSSMHGLVQFDPLAVPAIFPEEDIQIYKLWLDEKLIDTIPSQLKISQEVYEVKLNIKSTYYGHPSNYIIQYSIQGLTDGWHSLTGNKEITIQNARHGDYDLVIRKRNGFGADDFDYLSYPIKISPYYYETSWFNLIIGLVLTGIITGIYRWYQRYNIQLNKKLEGVIKKRTTELSLTNHNLKDQIKQNDLFQSIFVHDIKSPIRFITSNSELLRRHWFELDDDLKLTNLHHIHDASANIGNFIEETLLWMKIQKSELEIKNEEFKVLPLLQGIIDLYKTNPKIINGDIQLLIRCSPELNCLGDTHLLSTILRNLLANSIKYTKKGSIELFAIKSIDGKLSVGCSDTGVGMSQHLIDQLLSKEYQGNDIRKDSYKMGFVIIKDITKTLNGLLTISSKVNSGTKVVIEFGNAITNYD